MRLINKSNRKPFSEADYARYNTMAYQLIQEDMPDFYIHQPAENYGIDTFGYSSREAAEAGAEPLFAIELEVKRSGNWGAGEYPYDSIHFLARKGKNLAQPCIPFFVQYNAAGTNALVIPYPRIFTYPLGQMHGARSDDGKQVTHSDDYYYDVAKSAAVFGREHIQEGILGYYASLLNVDPAIIQRLPESMMAKGNRIYTVMIGQKAA